MILLDTSACIEALRATGSVAHLAVARLMASRQANQAAICGPVLLEVQMGASFDKVARVSGWLDHLRYLGLREPDDFESAADLFRRVRRAGRTIRSSIDCLIAAIAIRNGAQLLHCDRDYEQLAKVSPLKILDPGSLVA